jgi:hypothetical protein
MTTSSITKVGEVGVGALSGQLARSATPARCLHARVTPTTFRQGRRFVVVGPKVMPSLVLEQARTAAFFFEERKPKRPSRTYQAL